MLRLDEDCILVDGMNAVGAKAPTEVTAIAKRQNFMLTT